MLINTIEMKRIVISFLFALMAVASWAYNNHENDIEIDSLYFRIEDGKATVTGTKKSKGRIIIPATISNDGNTYPVETIGRYAFSACYDIESIDIPNSVTVIDDWAFYFCMSIEYVHIPASVVRIGEGAFSGCTKIADVTVDKDNKFYDSREDCNAAIHTATNELVIGCRNTVIPASVTRIGNDSFSDRLGISKVTIPDAVTSFGIGSFANSDLKFINIPKNLNHIGAYAFADCISIDTFTCYATEVPATGDNAFMDSNIESATLLVSESALEAYKTTEPWCLFGTIKTIEEAEVMSIVSADTTPLLVAQRDGIVTVRGLQNGETVTIYTIDGRMTAYSTAERNTAVLNLANLQGSIAVLMVGEKRAKVVVE